MAEPPGTEKSLAAKVLTICAVGVLISLGMCGLADQMRGSWEAREQFSRSREQLSLLSACWAVRFHF